LSYEFRGYERRRGACEFINNALKLLDFRTLSGAKLRALACGEFSECGAGRGWENGR